MAEAANPRPLHPMAEAYEILGVGCKRHECLNAVLADKHGEVPSFLGRSEESVTSADRITAPPLARKRGRVHHLAIESRRATDWK